MRRPRVRLAAIAIALAIAGIWIPRPAAAQLFGGPAYLTTTVLSDTCAIAHMDSSLIVDMSNHRYAVIRVKMLPPAGGAEPWSYGVLRFIASTTSNPDSNSTSIMQLQPLADHSYIATATGDSLGYGAWATANQITVGNGEVPVHSQRPNSKWPYPGNAWTFELGNKGQVPHVRYFYIQSRIIAAGGAGATRVIIQVTRSN